jgi:hypothetical protein
MSASVRLRLVGAALLFAAMPVTATETSTSPDQASIENGAAPAPLPAKPKAKPTAANRKICKTVPLTGSNIGRKTRACLTRREWHDRGM